MSKVEEAVSCFNEGFMCSQALLSTYGEQFCLDRETALKVSAALVVAWVGWAKRAEQ